MAPTGSPGAQPPAAHVTPPLGSPGSAYPIKPGGYFVGPEGPHKPGTPLDPNASYTDKVRNGDYMTQGVPLQQPDASQLQDQDNPDKLRAAELADNAAGRFDDAATARNRRGEIINGTGDLPQRKDGSYETGYQQNARIKAANDTNAAAAQAQKQHINAQETDWTQNQPGYRQVLRSYRRVATETNPGALGQDWADLMSLGRSVPGLNGWLQQHAPDALGYEDNWEEGRKDNARLAMMQALASQLSAGAPAATMGHTDLTVPSLKMGSGAQYHLYTQMVGLNKYNQDFYSDWDQHRNRVTDGLANYLNDRQNAHQIGDYERWAQDHTLPFKGMTPQEIRSVLRTSTPQQARAFSHGTYYLDPQGNIRQVP